MLDFVEEVATKRARINAPMTGGNVEWGLNVLHNVLNASWDAVHVTMPTA